MGFDYFDLGDECNEILYIQKFRELYSAIINIPEGYKVICGKSDIDIKHFWRGGKLGPFQKARAVRIGWIKEILEKKDRRYIKINPINRNIYFVSKKISKGTYYVVRCRYQKSKDMLRVYTAHLISRYQYELWLKWPDLVNKKSC